MRYHIAPLFCRPWTLNGLTPRLIESHYERNYGGELRRLNAIARELELLDPATASPEAIARLKRDEAAALNSTLLHELYFASLGEIATRPSGVFADALSRDFGGLERWQAEFGATAKALGGGSGWVILAYSARDKRLYNHWSADHSMAPAGSTPLLAIDMYEHAYAMDYGANAGAYVDAFLKIVKWPNAERLYREAMRV